MSTTTGTRALGSHRVLQRLLRHPTGCAGLVISALFVLIALTAPVLAPGDPAAVDFANVLAQPGPDAPLGTDELGRDQLTRTLHGIRSSMLVGVLSVVLALVAATPLGLIAGYYRGIPFWWRLGDCSFGVIGFGVLWPCYRMLRDKRGKRDEEKIFAQG